MTDNIVVTATDDSGNEYENLGELTVQQLEALVERVDGPAEAAVDELAAMDDVSRDEALAEKLAEAGRLAQQQAERDERTRLREIERELARQRAVKFSYDLARIITANAGSLKYEGKPIVGAWSNAGNVLIMLNTEKQVSLYTDEYDLRSYQVEDAVRAQAEANGHQPSAWSWNGELGRVSGCLLCDGMVRIGDDNVPRVDAYNKRCAKAAIVAGKRAK